MSRPDSRRPGLITFAVLFLSLALAGCGGGGGGDGEVLGARSKPTAVEQAAFDGARYGYGAAGATPTLAISGAPDDIDSSRWAMLHDGAEYRLYFMRLGSDTTLYQFGYNDSTRTYEFGHNSITQMDITGAPAQADPGSIAMLHDGSDYRLYMRGRDDPAKIYQFAFNASTGDYEYGFRSIDVINTTNIPPDADLSRWAMLHDGTTYRQYVAKSGSETTLYQFGFNGGSYAFGHSSIPELDVEGMPPQSDTSSFAMCHSGTRYRFYHLSR